MLLVLLVLVLLVVVLLVVVMVVVRHTAIICRPRSLRTRCEKYASPWHPVHTDASRNTTPTSANAARTAAGMSSAGAPRRVSPTTAGENRAASRCRSSGENS